MLKQTNRQIKLVIVASYHAVQQVESSQADGLVLVIQTLKDEVFVRLH